jgi:hypothetical protein
VDILEKYKITVNKRTLLLLAGVLWSFAGGRILTLGYEDLFINSQGAWEYLLFSLVTFSVFYVYIFSKMVKKHINRIISSSLSRHCIFSFFDLRGYAVMIVMIAGGIALRNAHVINAVYLGSFYLGLGSALFSAGIKFLTAVWTF